VYEAVCPIGFSSLDQIIATYDDEMFMAGTNTVFKSNIHVPRTSRIKFLKLLEVCQAPEGLEALAHSRILRDLDIGGLSSTERNLEVLADSRTLRDRGFRGLSSTRRNLEVLADSRTRERSRPWRFVKHPKESGSACRLPHPERRGVGGLSSTRRNLEALADSRMLRDRGLEVCQAPEGIWKRLQTPAP
jgi:hypothetical protein